MPYSKNKHLIFLILLLLLLAYPAVGRSFSMAQTRCEIEIDRSAVPDLNHKNLTLLITVNDAAEIQLTSNSQPVPYSQVQSQLLVTTDLRELELQFTPGTNSTDLCKTEKAALLNDKHWAWSHGFDDNVYLRDSIDEFRAKSWPATLFLIADRYDQTREEAFIIDEPYVNQTLIPEGWAIGNHSWSHENFSSETPTIDDYRDDILLAQKRMEEGIDRSSMPDLKVISFASPNFKSEYEAPFYELSQTTDLMLLEVGNDTIFQVADNRSYSFANKTIPPLGNGSKIGRDPSIEFAINEVIANFDWLAQHSSESVRFWYNTLSHGHHESNIKLALDHVWDNYGPGGTNEVWVTSSTEIYSYILTRDLSLVSVTKDGVLLQQDDSIYLPIIVK